MPTFKSDEEIPVVSLLFGRKFKENAVTTKKIYQSTLLPIKEHPELTSYGYKNGVHKINSL